MNLSQWINKISSMKYYLLELCACFSAVPGRYGEDSRSGVSRWSGERSAESPVGRANHRHCVYWRKCWTKRYSCNFTVEPFWKLAQSRNIMNCADLWMLFETGSLVLYKQLLSTSKTEWCNIVRWQKWHSDFLKNLNCRCIDHDSVVLLKLGTSWDLPIKHITVRAKLSHHTVIIA